MGATDSETETLDDLASAWFYLVRKGVRAEDAAAVLQARATDRLAEQVGLLAQVAGDGTRAQADAANRLAIAVEFFGRGFDNSVPGPAEAIAMGLSARLTSSIPEGLESVADAIVRLSEEVSK